MFKYFLAEILLLWHEPFQLGDRIIVEGFEGTLEKILWRSTGSPELMVTSLSNQKSKLIRDS
ncbi:mechanosensitive ion channel domain-containing protein [Microcoleus sp. Pol12B5]|uniref:mechanosensitive ion channel domain-containing protein n=1 Tax=Microcoleus sp. Pol12B5 TaxID=3055396 RepID=UPI002FD70DD3